MRLSSLFAVAVATSSVTAISHTKFDNSVEQLMDLSVDPCDDFYQYSCGGWLAKARIPDDKQSVGNSFGDIASHNEQVIQEILLQDRPPLLTEFYESCVNMDAINALGAMPLQQNLEKIRAVKSKPELFTLAGALGKTGPSFFTDIGVSADAKDAATNVLWVGIADLTLPDQDYYLDNTTFAMYEEALGKYIVSVLELAGWFEDGSNDSHQSHHHHHHHHHYHHKHHHNRKLENQHTHIHIRVHSEDDTTAADSVEQYSYKKKQNDAKDTIIRIERTVAAMFPPKENYQDPEKSYFPVTAKKSATKYSLTFDAFANGMDLLTDTNLTDGSKIIFTSLDYFDQAEELVTKMELRDLQLLLAYRYISHYSHFLSQPFLDANFELFSKTLNGVQKPFPRERLCTMQEIDFFPILLGKYYFHKMFDSKREEYTAMMIQRIEAVMKEHIESLQWLDDATRNQALIKLAKVSNLIGHSHENQTYEFTFDRQQYLDNADQIALDGFHRALNRIGKPVDRTHWKMSAAEVNAYYAPSMNNIVFPDAILQPPFFNGSAHPAQNFGSIGTIIGHELTHGFDSTGRLYDGYGNLHSWWTNATTDEFETRAQCLKDQYSSFEVMGENDTFIGHVDGNLTIGENIADNGGMRLSFDAYNKYMASDGVAIPSGTELSSEEEGKQLFFVAFAQSFCRKIRDGAARQRLETDPHSPAQWRVNGAVMNNNQFAEAFQCPSNAKMNPKTKCVIW